MIDFDKINAAALANAESLLVQLFPNGELNGSEFCIGSVNGEQGGSLAFNIRTGLWADFDGSAEGRNLTTFWAYSRGIKNSEAATEINSLLNAGGLDSAHAAKFKAAYKSTADDWIVQPYADADVSAPTEHPRKVKGVWIRDPIAKSWAYRTSDGKLVGYVCRVNYDDGTKDCFPYSYCKNVKTGECAWKWKGLPRPTPLYNVQRLKVGSPRFFIGVEGEKVADAVQAIAPAIPVITWCGGAGRAKHHPEYTDWESVRGMDGIFFPDADSATDSNGNILPESEQPGIAAMLSIEKHLTGVAESTFVVRPPDDWKDGYDLADAIRDGWTFQRIMQHVAKRKQENIRVGIPVVEDIHADEAASQNAQDDAGRALVHIDEQTIEPADEGPLNEAGEVLEIPKRDDRFKWPFECFGTRGTTAYFRIRNSSVQSFDIPSMNRGSLECLADVGFWLQNFPDTEKECSVSWNTAISAVRNMAFASGSYSIMRLRGLGFWFDGNDVVVHVGDKLIVNGSPKRFIEYQSKYIYETIEDLGEGSIDYDPSILPLPAKSVDDCAGAAKILDLCKTFPWRDPMSAYFLAGWIALAPICGVLKWRPHAWITGPAGCGKSTTLLGDTVKPLLGNGLFVDVQSSTTPPAIAESCGNNAIPVVYDEAEAQTKMGIERMARVIEQMRSSSTENAPPIKKGMPGGVGIRLMKPRQMYLLASTAAHLTQGADIRRVTKLDMYKRDEAVNEKLYRGPGGTLDLISQTTADENFCKAFRQRLYQQSRITLENIKTFRKVVGKKLHDVPEGDQKGTLLAGAWGLRSSRIATEEEVTAWVNSLQWDTWAVVASDKDEYACLNLLLATQFRLDDSDGRSHPSSIGEILMHMISGNTWDDNCQGEIALIRCGVKIAKDRSSFWVASQTSHPFLRDTFAKSAFADQWKDQLMRIPGAENCGAVRFGAANYRAVKIPMATIKPPPEETAVEE